MRQLEAAKVICDIVKNDPTVRAVFLKGSLARDDFDQYSDVDLYCLIKKGQVETFLPRRLDYLERYRPLLFWSEANFVGPQIVAVFDNGLHFDLYAVTLENLPKTERIKVLHDPDQLLRGYESQPLALAAKDVVRAFDSFSFSLLEFEVAYKRGDLLWASRLASHLSSDLALMLRYTFDQNNSQLGLKGLHKKLDQNLHKKMSQALDLCGPSALPAGVMLFVEIAAETVQSLPSDLQNKTNLRFFNYMAERMAKLNV